MSMSHHLSTPQLHSEHDAFLAAIQEQLDYVTACEYAAQYLRTEHAERLFATAVADLECMMVEYQAPRRTLH
jgi:hypothetical protein